MSSPSQWDGDLLCYQGAGVVLACCVKDPGDVRYREHKYWPRMADKPTCYFCAVWPPGAVVEWRWLWSDVGQLADVRGARLNARICRCEGDPNIMGSKIIYMAGCQLLDRAN